MNPLDGQGASAVKFILLAYCLKYSALIDAVQLVERSMGVSASIPAE
jgi:hypothetical protein